TFTNIDQYAQPLSIPTPYDTTIITLKEKLNETCIVYGLQGFINYGAMLHADTIAAYGDLIDPTKAAKYVIVKSNKVLNAHPDWDLVDAYEKNPAILDTIDMKTLADSLKTRSRDELKRIVQTTAAEKKRVQGEIAELATKQEKFIKLEKEKRKTNEPQTLESEIERMI